MIKLLILLFNIVLFSSCAGYKWVSKENPFARYGIYSISVPMFLNQSNMPGVSSAFTAKSIHLFSEFDGLDVVAGFDKNSDAVLIGKIISAEKFADTVMNQEIRVANAVAPNEIGNKRGDFYVPAVSKIQLKVVFILVKEPTAEELKFFESKYADKLIEGKKIVFQETIDVADTFNREIFDSPASKVNYTQNREARRRTLDSMAQSSVNSLKDMILYAF